jgi:hypothetical protein
MPLLLHEKNWQAKLVAGSTEGEAHASIIFIVKFHHCVACSCSLMDHHRLKMHPHVLIPELLHESLNAFQVIH